MSSVSDKGTTTTAGTSPPGHQEPEAAHANWRESLMGLIASRVALFQLESKDATQAAAKRAIFIVAAGICAFFAWGLLVAGFIAIISESAGWPWSRVALGFAALHLVIGIILAKAAKPSGNPAFPITRAEFQKDREWIENFNKAKKSSD